MNNSHKERTKNPPPMPRYTRKKASTMKCPVIFGYDKKGNTKLIYCGQWTCPNCAPRLARKWAIRVKVHIGIEQDRTTYQWYMLTLTLGSTYKEPVAAYGALKKLWNRLRMAIARDHPGDKWQYAAFVEGQPKRQSMPHFHIIMDVQPPAKRNKKGVITKRAIHDYAHKMGWGFEAELKPVNSQKAASYVSKYVSKGAGVVPKGFRRVRVSRGWSPLVKDPDKRLIVIRKGEELHEYLDRVNEFTGVPHEELYEKYLDAERQLEEANADNPE